VIVLSRPLKISQPPSCREKFKQSGMDGESWTALFFALGIWDGWEAERED